MADDSDFFTRLYADTPPAPPPGGSPPANPQQFTGFLKQVYNPVGGYLESQASYGRSWGDVASDVQKSFPGVNVAELASGYKLESARTRASRMDEPGWLEFVRKSIGGASPVGSFLLEREYGKAMNRIQTGQAEDKDYDFAAQFERIKELDAQRSQGLLGGAREAVLRAPAILLEAGALGGVNVPARAAAGAVERFAVAQAVRTPFQPSLYLEHSQQNANANGGNWYDSKNLAPPLAMAYLQNLVLGSSAKIGGGKVFENTFTTQPGRIAAAGVLGVGEQAVADSVGGLWDDVGPAAYKTKTRYGVLGDLARGDTERASTQAAVQALTFSAFGLMHSRSPEKAKAVVDAYAEAQDALAKKGLNKDAAGAVTSQAMRPVADALADPNVETKADIAARVDAMKDGPMKDYAQAFVDSLPEEYTQARRSVPPARQPAPPAKPPEPAPGELTTADLLPQGTPAVPRPTEPGAKLSPGVQPPAPNDPIAVLGEAGILQIAKQFGFPGLKKGRTVQEVLNQLNQNPIPRALIQKAVEQTLAAKQAAPPPAGDPFAGLSDQDVSGIAQALGLSAESLRQRAQAGDQGILFFLDQARQRVTPNQPAQGPETVIQPPVPSAEPGATQKPSEPPIAPPEQSGETVSASPLPGRAARDEALINAHEAARHGKAAVYVDMDVDNMKGLAQVGGDAGAQEHARNMVEIVHEKLLEVLKGADVKVFRHAGDPQGDEHSIVVVGASKQQVDAALREAEGAVSRFNRSVGAADIPHTKGEGRPAGVGLSMYAEPILPQRPWKVTVSEAEVGLENVKARKIGQAGPAGKAGQTVRQRFESRGKRGTQEAKPNPVASNIEPGQPLPPEPADPNQMSVDLRLEILGRLGMGPSERQWAATWATLENKSLREVAKALGVSHQTIANDLAAVAKRLDIPLERLKEAAVNDGIEGFVSAGNRVNLSELKADPAVVRARGQAKLDANEVLQNRLKAATDAFLKEIGDGEGTPEQRAAFEAELARIRGSTEGASFQAPKPAPVAPANAAPGQAPAATVKRQQPAYAGRETLIAVPGGEPIPAHYQLVELADLKPSHRAGDGRFLPTAGYPEGLQPRDYRGSPGEQRKVLKGADHLNPARLLSDIDTATDGPPAVSSDGFVVNGNGRAMMLQRSAAVGTYPAYKAELAKRAGAFGFDAAAVEGMKEPVLVRTVDMPGNSPEAARFARAGNVSFTQSQSPVRTAASLGGLIDRTLLDSLKLDGDTTFSEAVTDPVSGRAFRSTLKAALPPSEVDRYFHADGRLTESGQELARNMLLAKIVPVDLIERLGEESKGIKRAVEGAIPQLLKLRRDFPEADPSHQLVEALGVLADHPKMRSLADAQNVLDQMNLFGERAAPLSPAGRMLLDFVLEHGKTPLVFRRKLTALVTDLDHAVNGLFAEPNPDVSGIAANALGVEPRPGAEFGALKEAQHVVQEGKASGLSAQAIRDGLAEVQAEIESDAAAAERDAAGARDLPSAEQRNVAPGGKPLRMTDEPGQIGGIPGLPGNPGAPGVTLSPGERTFALARAKAEQQRAEIGLPRLTDAERFGNPEAWHQAEAALAINPRAGAELVSELEGNIRPITSAEGALLLHRRIELANRLANKVRIFNGRSAVLPEGSPEIERLRREVEDLKGEHDRTDSVIRAVGSQLGRGLQFYRQLAKEDYSLAGMLSMARFQKGGKPLTESENKEVERIHEEIKQADEKAAAAEAEPDKAAPKGEVGDALDLEIAQKNVRKKYGEMLAKLRFDALPWHHRAAGHTFEVSNAIRTFLTAYDLSAVLRQGAILTYSHPIKAAQAVPDMLRSFFSERHFQRSEAEIRKRPNALLYEKSGLYLADRDALLNTREEAFLGKWVDKIPGVKASERAYVSFLNRMRADVFDSLASTVARNGKPTEAEGRALANYVNVATGRGHLGPLDKAAAGLAHIFFSPRYLASRVQFLAGQPFYQGTPATRKLIAQEYARAALGLAVFYGVTLALNDDATLSFNPRSADFGKMKFGSSRVDPLAGFGQLLVFGSRLATGETTSSTTGKTTALRGPDVLPSGTTTGDVVLRFLRSKLAPVPGVVMDALTGETPVGEPVTPETVGKQLAVPISFKDVSDALNDQGMPRGAALSLLAILGMSAQSYEKRPRTRPPEPLLPVFPQSDLTRRRPVGARR